MALLFINLSSVQPDGEWPVPLIAMICSSSAKITTASEPKPLPVGSTTVRTIAAASAASTAFPPFCKILIPACVARGCEEATMFSAKTGILSDL